MKNSQPESLYALRYPQKADKDGVLPDYFVRLWGDLAYYAQNLQTNGRVRSAKKYMLNFLAKLNSCPEDGGEKLAQLTESARVYLRCCVNDRNFASSLLGVMQMQQSAVNMKLASLIYDISETLPQKTALQSESAMLGNAMTAALKQELPELVPLYEAVKPKA